MEDIRIKILNDFPRTIAANWNKNNKNNFFTLSDVRARSYRDNTPIEFDRVPFQTNIDGLKSDIYDNCLDAYNASNTYDNYSYLKGDIQYYVNPSLQTPYPEENYIIPSEIYPIAYSDPMSRICIEYRKIPNYINDDIITGYRQIDDEMRFREDLMSQQSVPLNRTKYELACP